MERGTWLARFWRLLRGRIRIDTDTLELAEWLKKAQGSVGLVFSDIVDSTSLLYDEQTIDYSELLNAHRTRAASLIGRLGGRLIEEKGDEIFTLFPTVASALSYAKNLHQDSGHKDLRIRAGIHFGTVTANNDTLIGRNVHFAARVLQKTNKSEIWLSDAAKQQLDSEAPDLAGKMAWEAGQFDLKGIPEKQRLWRLIP